MSNLAYFENIIKEKRKKTSFRDFLYKMGSWIPLVFYRNNGIISRFPEIKRVKITTFKEFEENRLNLIKNGKNYDFQKTFFDNFSSLFKNIELPACGIKPGSAICIKREKRNIITKFIAIIIKINKIQITIMFYEKCTGFGDLNPSISLRVFAIIKQILLFFILKHNQK